MLTIARSSATFVLMAAAASAGANPIWLHCNAQRDAVAVDTLHDSHSRQGWTSTEIDVGPLVRHKTDSKGDVWRTGTRSRRHRCGVHTVHVSAGFYNANPQGELGAAEDFAVIEIRNGARTVLGPLRIGTCTAGSPREERCPADWAESFEVYGASAHVERRFSQIIPLPSSP